MFSNFTPRAQQVLALARKEADRLNFNCIGTEHLLLGLIKLGTGVGITVLTKSGLNPDTIYLEVEKQIGKSSKPIVIGSIPYTPETKRVLAQAMKEAKDLNHQYVGTEHLLLGLLADANGGAGRILAGFGLNLEKTRQGILRELNPNLSPNAEDHANASPPKPEHPAQKLEPVDLGKRYDVYCAEPDKHAVVYRNALFKGVRKLMATSPPGFMSEFVELEQANGQAIFLARPSIIKFCEHGVVPMSETIPDKKPE